jgi:tRNA threonylcarbamoyladenosine biosynthesis protein TsaB
VECVVILALETATTACSAALCAADGSVVAETVALEGPAHTQRLLSGVHEVLETAAASWSDVATVAVGLGPGAFTGLRIGVATARALAQADGRVRLAGVPTAAALALALAHLPEASAHRPLVPLIDGQRREVFAAVYAAEEAGGGVRVVEPLSVVPADGLEAWLARLGDVLVGGDGAVLYRDLLPVTARVADEIPAPTAAMVGRAVAREAPGLVFGADAVLPIYGRAPDAARWTGAGSAGRPASSGGAS